MPQLDKVSFLSQFFWLLIFFFGFYIFQLKFFLPEMSRILKFRKKRLGESSAVLLQQENNVVRNSADTVLENLFLNSKNVFKESVSKKDSWSSKQTNFFQKKFKNGNSNYLQSIAKKNLSNNFAIGAVGLHLVAFSGTNTGRSNYIENRTDISNKLFWSTLLQHCSYQGSSIKKKYIGTLSSSVTSLKNSSNIASSELSKSSSIAYQNKVKGKSLSSNSDERLKIGKNDKEKKSISKKIAVKASNLLGQSSKNTIEKKNANQNKTDSTLRIGDEGMSDKKQRRNKKK